MGTKTLSGIIDRLIISPGKVIAVDFKSNMVVPNSLDQVPEGLLRQMGAYAHGLSQIFPGRYIETALLWTHTAKYMVLPHEVVTNALALSGHLDGHAAAP